MPVPYGHKRSSVAGKVPVAGDFAKPGQILVNTADGRAFINATGGVKTLPNTDDVGALSGFRNKIINPLFAINQRGVTGTVTLAAGQYGHDRFKAEAGGCTYTYSTSNGITTINILSGSLAQVIEGGTLSGAVGKYVLTWAGTAEGRIGTGAWGASGIEGVVSNASFTLFVRWRSGTLSLPQLERDYATPFSPRHIQQEYALCQRYFRVNSTLFGSWGPSPTAGTIGVYFEEPMRAVPTSILQPGAAALEAHVAEHTITSLIGGGLLAGGGTLDFTSAAASAGGKFFTVSPGAIHFDAEI